MAQKLNKKTLNIVNYTNYNNTSFMVEASFKKNGKKTCFLMRKDLFLQEFINK